MKTEPFLSGETLQSLNSHLLDNSYVYGHQLSDIDVIVANHVDNSGTLSSLINLKRWLLHVSFSENKPLPVDPNTKKVVLAQYGNGKMQIILACQIRQTSSNF